jgi:hypothetical protein
MNPHPHALARPGRQQQEAADAARKREEAAAYIAQMAGDLAAIARRGGLDTLCYILDMARLEAENAVGPKKDDT